MKYNHLQNKRIVFTTARDKDSLLNKKKAENRYTMRHLRKKRYQVTEIVLLWTLCYGFCKCTSLSGQFKCRKDNCSPINSSDKIQLPMKQKDCVHNSPR